MFLVPGTGTNIETEVPPFIRTSRRFNLISVETDLRPTV